MPPPYAAGRAKRVCVVLNGRRVEARLVTADPPTYVVAPAEAAMQGLEMAKAPCDARIFANNDADAPAREAVENVV